MTQLSDNGNLPLPEGYTSFSHSRRQDIQMCPRLYYLKHIAKLEPVTTPKPLRIGSAYSDALEHKDPEMARAYYMKLIQDGAPAELADTFSEEAEIAFALSTTYLALHEDEDWEREHPFLRVIGDSKLVDRGRIDGLIITDDDDGNILRIDVLENKTKGRFGPAEIEALAMDEQLTGYIAQLSLEFSIPAEQIFVTYDIAMKPQLRMAKVDEGSRTKFIARQREAILTDANKYHKRIVDQELVGRTQEQCDKFINKTLPGLARYLELVTDEGEWREHPFSCSNYGGCAFINLCKAKPDEVQGIIAEQFKVAT